jgi:hypothetical protein
MTRRRKRYLLIVEHNNVEFIAGWYDRLSKVKEHVRLYIKLSFQCQDSFGEYFKRNFPYITSYRLNENAACVKANEITTSGFVTCSILKLTPALFDIQSFIRERETASTVFNLEEDNEELDKQHDKLIDMFPDVGRWVN